MRTILHVIDTPGPGGAETVYLNLVRGLDRSRFRSVVTVGGTGYGDRPGEGISTRGWLYDALVAAGIEPLLVRTERAFDLGYLARLVRTARRVRADVIHAHLLTSNVYCSAAGLIAGIPVISTFHGAVDITTGSRLTGLKLGVINRGSARIVFVSDHLRRAMLATTRLDPSRSVVVYNGIDCERFRPAPHDRLRSELGLGPAGLLVGAVGNLRPAKAYEVLIEAASVAAAHAPDMQFVIAGDDGSGLQAGLDARVAKLGLQRTVRFIGFRHDIPTLLNGVDVLALSSQTEGFSLVTVEAMACGLPVVATRSGGPQEIVVDGATGLLVDTGSPARLAEALLKLAADSALRHRLAAQGRARAIAQFDVGAMVRNYQSMYQAL